MSAWLDDVIAVYGEPRLSSDTFAAPPVVRDDEGEHVRRFWVWFPSNSNHHISIKQYGTVGRKLDLMGGERWVVTIGSHLGAMPAIEYRSRTEPDDALMRSLLALTGFLSTPVRVPVGGAE